MTVPKAPKSIDLELNDLTLEPNELGIQQEPIKILGEDPLDLNGRPVFEKPINDYLIHAEVMLPKGEQVSTGRVTGRSKGIDRSHVGTYNANPLLNSVVYDVEFPDSVVKLM